jgi:uncharacterized membrane protein YgcG
MGKANYQANVRTSYIVRILQLIAVAIILLASSAVYADDEEWPREIVIPEVKILMYQPQLETFKEDKLTARSAVSVTKKGETEPIFGAVWFAARVLTDRDTRIVKPLEVKVTDVKFPITDKSKEKKLAGILEKAIPAWDLTLSLDRLITMLELVEKEQASADDLKAIPPKIIYVSHPAVLVTIDGEPELSKVEDSKLMRIVNTPFFIVFDPEKKNYYLKGGSEWLSTKDIKGAWQSEPSPPATVVAAAATFTDTESESGEKQKTGSMPKIIVATAPTELIVSEGEPKFKSVTGTGLLYMSNTESDVFMEIGTQKYFVLLSGRWFASSSLTGPWSYVPADKLPSDFAKIPQGSDKGDVLANVSGTEQAREAVLDTHIPQTSTVKRDEKVEVAVEYDGTPEFKPIESTTMSYAVNTPNSVIRMGKYYYLCHEAVWYISDKPSGPWAVAVNVPTEIYTIPPSYPVYHVRYVYVYDYTPSVVYVGYTPGYTGTYVYGGTVVYGTGYYYRGWYRTVYYARPVTWGYSVRYSSVSGRWGVRVGYAAPGVWYSGRAVWGVGGIARRAYWRNEYRDRRDWRRDRYDDRRDFQKDRYDDRRDAQKDRGRDRPDRDGDRRDKVGEKRKDAPRTQDRKVGTDKKRQNNVYADRNGNAHRKTEQGWQKRDKSGWSKPDRSSSGSGRSNLNRDSGARERGSQRTQNYQRSRSSSSRSGISRSGSGSKSRSGSRSRGGGGRRR